MPLRTPAEKKMADTFLKKLGARVKAAAPTGHCLSIEGRCPKSKRPLSKPAPVPKQDDIHLFDAATFGIVAELIEELALTASSGEWTSTFGSFADLTPELRQRFSALGKSLDTVRVWGSGASPKRLPGVDLLAIDSPILTHYRLILLETPKFSTVLLVKELPSAKGESRYLGFYSFCPYLFRSIRRRLHFVGCGLDCMLKEWEKSFNLPKVTASDLVFLSKQEEGKKIAPKPKKKAVTKVKAKAKVAKKKA
ncbi:hypothetical protein SAMN05444156_0333 [Verrucomicrobium sp. GAS474]|uniref:hypothetical protein n=1 Tax=Verrucomicrobium sp. GAS474 TaxID=1882831 RepID=UPI00087D2FE9|nr:hypothetical protein [Verrucomicrobium sp. GAS474]SDT87676.1 hypothetical protein SAMN05444156_0333 [Verrucomicrobium sp. GAS474]